MSRHRTEVIIHSAQKGPAALHHAVETCPQPQGSGLRLLLCPHPSPMLLCLVLPQTCPLSRASVRSRWAHSTHPLTRGNQGYKLIKGHTRHGVCIVPHPKGYMATLGSRSLCRRSLRGSALTPREPTSAGTAGPSASVSVYRERRTRMKIQEQ